MWDKTSIKIKYELPKKHVLLIYDEKVPWHFRRISIISGIAPSRDSETKGVIVRIKKAIAILKRPVNKLFTTEYTYHDTNQTDKATEQKLRREAAVIDQLKRKYDC